MFSVFDLVPAFIAFGITAALGPVIIPFLIRLKAGQTERELGVEAHKKKTGTPTMGGIMFLVTITVAGLLFISRYPRTGPILFLTLAYGLLGFLDDYLKVVKKRSDGLFPLEKFGLQLVIILVFGIYIARFTDVSMVLRIPFTGGRSLDIGLLKWPLLVFAIGGTVNGVNFTDGVDGLAARRADLLRGPRRPSGLSRLQCPPGEGLHGRYRLTRARRLCHRDRVHAGYASLRADRGPHLCRRGTFGHAAGRLF